MNQTLNLKTHRICTGCMQVLIMIPIVFMQVTLSLYGQTTRYVTVTGNDLGGTNLCMNPDTPCRTITRALNAASDKDTIQIATGIYTESVSIGKSVILLGAGSANTIIQAHNQPAMTESRVITVTGNLDVEITDITIRHGNAGGFFPDNAGGGIYNNGASLIITNVHFNENSALNGGGMYNQSGSAVLTSVTFNRNKGSWGGGMANFNSSPLLSNVTFSENFADGEEGGGMYNSNGSSPVLINVIFRENQAKYGGGMQNVSGSSPELTDVTFSGNKAEHGGGMSNFSNSSPSLNDVVFIGNEAFSEGGGIYNFNNSSPNLNNITFTENKAGGDGGGLYNHTSFPILTHVHIIGNSARFGGGMFNYECSPDLADVTFLDNEAGIGGGMYNQTNSSPMLYNVQFISNSTRSGGYGGGMFNDINSSPIMINVTFSENIAVKNIEPPSLGGAMCNFRNSSPILINVTFRSNSAEYGGGMYNSNSSPSLTNVLFTGNNSVENNGGGILNSRSSPILTNVVIAGNNAVRFGGGMSNYQNSFPKIVNSIIWGNSAGIEGNEIFNDTSTQFETGSSTELSYSLYKNGTGDIIEGDGFITDGHSITVDPLFVDASIGNVRLQPGSPAINAGYPDTDLSIFHTNEDGIPMDLDGNPRIYNGRIDMGAYEYHDHATYVEEVIELPRFIKLHQNYPNPFNPSTIIRYGLPERTQVELIVFDLLGRTIAVLVNDLQPAGRYDIHFHADNLPSGIYLYSLRTPTSVQIMKMILIR